MAQSRSELLSGVGAGFEILKAIVDAVLARGGTDENVREILRNGDIPDQIAELLVQSSVIQATYSVVVDYTKSLSQMVKAGKYELVNSNIIADHFPIKGEGQQEVEVTLFHFGRTMSSEEVISELKKAGYRPARIEELLALGAERPELQKQFSVVALGSVWRSPVGGRSVPCLDWCAAGRNLRLRWLGFGWGGGWRFAAVRK